MGQHLYSSINLKQATLVLRCLALVEAVFVWPGPGRQCLRVSTRKNPMSPEWLGGKHGGSARQETSRVRWRELLGGLLELYVVQWLVRVRRCAIS